VEIDLVGLFRNASNQFVKPFRVLANQNAPSVRLNAVENDGRRPPLTA